MKKNYFMLAATTMMLAACAQTDVVNEIAVEETPQAIGFETFANKATRADATAENSGVKYEWDLSVHHKTFKVWASKQLDNGSYVNVYAAGSPGIVTYTNNWTANPLKYWDKAAKNYEFYAAAPANLNWVAYNTDSKDGYLSLGEFELKGTGNLAKETDELLNNWIGKDDVDLMIAAPCNVPEGYYYNTEADPVQLNFIHILSRLNIAVATTSDANIDVLALNVVGLKCKGSFEEKNVAGLENGTTNRWTPEDDTYTLSAAGSQMNIKKGEKAKYTHQYLVLPQLVKNELATQNSGTAPAETYIYLKYTVNGEVFETYYGLAQAFGIAKTKDLAFNEGWQNTLTITIAPEAIEFTANVATWAGGTSKDNTID